MTHPDRLYHVSRATNRDSIRRHGLHWKLMPAGALGIAGSTAPELDAIFLCESAEEADFFVGMGSGDRVDVWEVDASGFPIEDGPDGWLICRAEIPADRVVLFAEDARVGPESGVPGVRILWNGGSGSNWFKAQSAEEARHIFMRELQELQRAQMGDVLIERWEGGRVIDSVELDGAARYPTPAFSSYRRSNQERAE